MKKKIAAIILSAGKGKRMGFLDTNKVTVSVLGKPLIVNTVELLRELGIDQIVIVVGHAKNSVEKLFSDGVTFVEQQQQLGTAHAALTGLRTIPQDIQNILILNGDGFYPRPVLESVIKEYLKSSCSCIFLTVKLNDPNGIGRIIRDEKGNVLGIVEEKDASDSIRAIEEVNAGCYIGRTVFFKKYLPQIDKSPITGEYYLTDIVSLAIKNKEKLRVFDWGEYPWIGINTKHDLEKLRNRL